MPAAYVDQYLEQGTTFFTTMTLDDQFGTPYNLTGFTIKSQAKRSYYSNTTTLTFNTSIFDATNGIISLSADAATTANLSPGKLVYDVLVTDTSGTVTRVVEGQIFVSPAVTK